jgi:multiple sugar transport system permease protein
MTAQTVASKKVAQSAAKVSTPRSYKKGIQSGLVTLLTIGILGLFLSPFLYMVFTSLKSPEQLTTQGTPIYPAKPATFEYQGKALDVYKVPMPDGNTKELAMLKPGRTQSTFVDPQNPSAAPIVWQGAWRSLERPWKWSPTWDNYTTVWTTINFPRLMWNTTFYAIMTEIGTLLSCILVAYGFSRFRYPGRDFLFVVMISTIFLPAAVTLIPTYTFFTKIGWVGTWLPLIVPAFFANAYDVFLLRQYFMTLPRDLDEAAMIDGAGPLRILWAVILPQSMPALVAITVFHIVWAWNDFFGPLIYLSTKPDLQPISVALSQFNGIYGTRPTLIQAGAMMAMIAPLILFALAQRFFVQGIVITGVEK